MLCCRVRASRPWLLPWKTQAAAASGSFPGKQPNHPSAALSFDDPSAFRVKSFSELLRALGVFCFCSFPMLVNNCGKVRDLGHHVHACVSWRRSTVTYLELLKWFLVFLVSLILFMPFCIFASMWVSPVTPFSPYSPKDAHIILNKDFKLGQCQQCVSVPRWTDNLTAQGVLMPDCWDRLVLLQLHFYGKFI